jgi:hypothetical protein
VADYAGCTLPPLSTQYSDSSFNITTMQDDLRPRATFGTLLDNDAVFDDDLVVVAEEGDQV